VSRRLAVIGAGVAGLATALASRDRGLEVAVFEAGRAGRGSTWAGAGILYPLLPWHYDEIVSRWCREGIAMQAAWLAALREVTGIDPEYRATGMRVVGACEPDALAWLRRAGETHARDGADLLIPGVAQVRNPRLAEALVSACGLRGVTIHEGLGEVRPDISGSVVNGVRWGGGQWRANAVVVCAGAWSGRLPGVGGARVYPVRGQMLALRAPELRGEIVYQDGRYLVPRQDGVVLLGSTMEHAGFDAGTTPRAAAELLAWASSRHPDLGPDRVIRHWAGLRPGSRLNHPLVGPYPGIEGLWLNTGHFRYGLTMAPACAASVASLIAG
jgi:glycine oxidase